MALEKARSGLESFFDKLQSQSKISGKKPYIIPTSFGLVFGTIALILLLFALGYANNLLGLFVFLLISFAVTSMFIANRNMHFTKITDVLAHDIYAEQDNALTVVVENSSDLPRYDFYVATRGNKTRSEAISVVEPRQTSHTKILIKPLHRGYQKLPRLTLESFYPFQMLRTWRYFYKKEDVLVYPALEGSFEFPQSEESSNQSGEQGLFRDHKLYSVGDSIRRINWLKSTRHQEILVKNFENNKDQSYDFYWEQTARLSDTEERISQLALWIYRCEQLGYSYSLKVHSNFIATGKGILHLRECMKLLALLKENEL